jgi:hypothetical protein
VSCHVGGPRVLRVGRERAALKSCSDHLFLVFFQAFLPRAFHRNVAIFEHCAGPRIEHSSTPEAAT